MPVWGKTDSRAGALLIGPPGVMFARREAGAHPKPERMSAGAGVGEAFSTTMK